MLCEDRVVHTEPEGVESARNLLVGREISAVCFVRYYLELHLDGPIVRAVSNPYGVFGGRSWRFPEAGAPDVMLSYIGNTVDGFRFEADKCLSIDSGEHSFVIPLDDSSRTGPEAAHIVGVDENGRTDTKWMWIW